MNPCKTCNELTEKCDQLNRLWWMFAGWNMPVIASMTLARHKAECEKETK